MKPLEELSKPRTAVEIRLQAAEIIRRNGWCQDCLENSKGEVCLLGALLKAESGNANGFLESAASLDAFRQITRLVKFIPAWNNAPGRTKEEVIALLEDI